MATLLEKLKAAGLPIESATESGAIAGLPGVQMTPEQEQTFKDILLEHFKPAEYADLLIGRADISQLKSEYQTTITQLQSIESAVNPTNAQVIAAVKFLAKTLRLLLKLLTRNYK
jgi:hypothetical protein